MDAGLDLDAPCIHIVHIHIVNDQGRGMSFVCVWHCTLEAEGVVELGFEAEAVLVAAGSLELEALALTPLQFP